MFLGNHSKDVDIDKKLVIIDKGNFQQTGAIHYAGVAQSVEQLICNQQVGGSSPLTSSTAHYGGFPEWPKGADCKSVVSDFGGSNPPSPTTQKSSKS